MRLSSLWQILLCLSSLFGSIKLEQDLIFLLLSRQDRDAFIFSSVPLKARKMPQPGPQEIPFFGQKVISGEKKKKKKNKAFPALEVKTPLWHTQIWRSLCKEKAHKKELLLGPRKKKSPFPESWMNPGCWGGRSPDSIQGQIWKGGEWATKAAIHSHVLTKTCREVVPGTYQTPNHVTCFKEMRAFK